MQSKVEQVRGKVVACANLCVQIYVFECIVLNAMPNAMPNAMHTSIDIIHVCLCILCVGDTLMLLRWIMIMGFEGVKDDEEKEALLLLSSLLSSTHAAEKAECDPPTITTLVLVWLPPPPPIDFGFGVIGLDIFSLTMSMARPWSSSSAVIIFSSCPS